METVHQALDQVAQRWLPRLLTQVCRDPASPHWGAFDRDWWHYRIRDFPSIILQQGGYALALAAQRAEPAAGRDGLRQLAAAAARFWNERALRRGAFEEYYPWEQGYPPLAFATLAMLKLAADGVVAPAELQGGAAVAARQLRTRFEAQAANQQVAGLAALAWCRRLYPELVPAAEFAALAHRTLALQTAEGWFEEYGGPDLGYLSVTIDCLWHLFDATGDARFPAAIERAAEYIQRQTELFPVGSLGMHNSRNTDYLVPYGLVRLAVQHATPENQALVHRLFAGAAAPGHFLAAVDDRYVSHYVGQSVFRAVLLLGQTPSLPVAAPAGAARAEALEEFTAGGHFRRRTADGQTSLVTLAKGGILSHFAGAAFVHDFGWVVQAADGQHLTHWWSAAWQHGQADGRLWVEGLLYRHREVASTPARHLALRLASRLAGNRLIGQLKQRLIFAKPPSSIRLRRTVEWRDGEVRVVDRFSGVPAQAEFRPAPRSSKRHVASADSFHPEDFQLLGGYRLARTFHRSAAEMEIVSSYQREA